MTEKEPAQVAALPSSPLPATLPATLPAPSPSPSPNSGGYRPAVGERVLVGKNVAVCRFVGTTQFADGEWIGLELEEPMGKNDGSVKGVRYFECKVNYGIFTRQAVIKRPRPPEGGGGEDLVGGDGSGSPMMGPTLSNKKPIRKIRPSIKGACREELMDREQLRRELAEAAEERDVPRITFLLPFAERGGVIESEIKNAQQILQAAAATASTSSRSAIGVGFAGGTAGAGAADVHGVKEALGKLSTAAQGNLDSFQTLLTKLAETVDRLERAPSLSMNSEQMDRWVQDFEVQLKGRVLKSVEAHMQASFSRAIEKDLEPVLRSKVQESFTKANDAAHAYLGEKALDVVKVKASELASQADSANGDTRKAARSQAVASGRQVRKSLYAASLPASAEQDGTTCSALRTELSPAKAEKGQARIEDLEPALRTRMQEEFDKANDKARAYFGERLWGFVEAKVERTFHSTLDEASTAIVGTQGGADAERSELSPDEAAVRIQAASRGHIVRKDANKASAAPSASSTTASPPGSEATQPLSEDETARRIQESSDKAGHKGSATGLTKDDAATRIQARFQGNKLRSQKSMKEAARASRDGAGVGGAGIVQKAASERARFTVQFHDSEVAQAPPSDRPVFNNKKRHTTHLEACEEEPKYVYERDRAGRVSFAQVRQDSTGSHLPLAALPPPVQIDCGKRHTQIASQAGTGIHRAPLAALPPPVQIDCGKRHTLLAGQATPSATTKSTDTSAAEGPWILCKRLDIQGGHMDDLTGGFAGVFESATAPKDSAGLLLRLEKPVSSSYSSLQKEQQQRRIIAELASLQVNASGADLRRLREDLKVIGCRIDTESGLLDRRVSLHARFSVDGGQLSPLKRVLPSFFSAIEPEARNVLGFGFSIDETGGVLTYHAAYLDSSLAVAHISVAAFLGRWQACADLATTLSISVRGPDEAEASKLRGSSALRSLELAPCRGAPARAGAGIRAGAGGPSAAAAASLPPSVVMLPVASAPSVRSSPSASASAATGRSAAQPKASSAACSLAVRPPATSTAAQRPVAPMVFLGAPYGAGMGQMMLPGSSGMMMLF